MAEELRPGPDRYLVNIVPILSQGFFLDQQLTIQGIHALNENSLKEGAIFERRKANRNIVVAYFIKSKFPDVTRFTNKIFARGISLYWYDFKLDKSARENKFIKEYFKSLSWIGKIEVVLMVLYHVLIKRNMQSQSPHFR
jgi:hypothetical protein